MRKAGVLGFCAAMIGCAGMIAGIFSPTPERAAHDYLASNACGYLERFEENGIMYECIPLAEDFEEMTAQEAGDFLGACEKATAYAEEIGVDRVMIDDENGVEVFEMDADGNVYECASAVLSRELE